MIDVDTLEQIISDFEGNVHSTEFAKELIKHLERSLPKPEASDELMKSMRESVKEVESWPDWMKNAMGVKTAAMNKPAVVDENKLQAAIATIIIKNQQITKRKHSEGVLVHGQLAAATEIINALRPYLRDTKPVFEQAAKAALETVLADYKETQMQFWGMPTQIRNSTIFMVQDALSYLKQESI